MQTPGMAWLSANPKQGELSDHRKHPPSILVRGGGCAVIDTRSKVRVLTPIECWRLMGLCPMNPDGTFDDTNFDKAAEVVSESQLYQQAGNSIVVDVLVNLYLSFLAPETKTRQATIDSWGE